MDSAGGNKKKTEVTIRQMEIDDISTVYRLGDRLFTSEEFPILYRTWDAYEVTDAFTSDPEFCLVAEEETEQKVVGFILATTIEKERTAWKKYGYVSWIGVEETYQRSNLGHRLYKKLEERLSKSGVRMVIADTDADNEEAISFFRTIGFSNSSRHLWLVKTLHRRTKKNAKTGENQVSNP